MLFTKINTTFTDMKQELNFNYETYLVINELRENYKFIDDITDIARSSKGLDDQVRALRGYVETWYLSDINYNKYPLHKALWLSAYQQVDWVEVLIYFRDPSNDIKNPDDDK